MMRVLQAGWSPIGDFPDMNATAAKKFGTGTHTSYVGGMPVGLVATGFVCGGQAGMVEVTAGDISAATGLTSNFLGLLFNHVLVDIRRGNGDVNETSITWALPTIVLAPCYVELWRGTSGSTDLPMQHNVADDRAPFLEDTWAINDLIYVEASATAADNGRLTDTVGAPNTSAIGRVLKAPADDTETMIALIWAATPVAIVA